MNIRVTRAKKIFSDGQHNAFTGIAGFNGKVFVTFRSGERHISDDAGVKVLASSDRDAWAGVADVRLPGADLRDPKIVAFKDELFVFCAAVRQKGPVRERRSMVCRSADGLAFGRPAPLNGIPENYWLWHAATHAGRIYGTAYRMSEGRYDVLLCDSDDGVNWKVLTEFPVPGNEVYLDIDREGILWALVRNDHGGQIPALCSAEPPYTTFQSVLHLPMRLQGPMVKRLAGGCVIVCRQWEPPLRRNTRTDIFWLEDGLNPRFVRSLPSGGDTSYAGWLDTGPGTAVMSYYSSHEYKMEEPHENNAALARDPAHAEHSTPADIFLADLSYSL